MFSGVTTNTNVSSIPKVTSIALTKPIIKQQSIGQPLQSLFAILQSWGMINSQGVLSYPSGVNPKSLRGISLQRWETLMKKEIEVQIGKETLKFTHKDYAYKLNAYLSKCLEREVKTYLRGGYALYVVNLPEYLEELVDEFLSDKKNREKRKAEIDPLLKDLRKRWEGMEEPTDVDWLDIADCTSHDALLLTTFFLGESKHLDPRLVNKEAFSKLVKTSPSLLKMEKTRSFLIYSLKNKNNCTVDRATGDLRHLSLASWCDIFIPIVGVKDIYGIRNYIPVAISNDFPQVVIDWGIRAIRLKEWHQLNFPALAAFCQYITQGFELLPSAETLSEKLQLVCFKVKTDEEAYQALLIDIDSRINGHKIEKVSFLFSVAMQFFLAFTPADRNQIGARLWKDLLVRMQQVIPEKELDAKLIAFFTLFKDDFSALVANLVHFCMAAIVSKSDKFTLSQIYQGAVTFKIGTAQLYLRKDLFALPFDVKTTKELEQFLDLRDLSSNGTNDEKLKDVVAKYVEAADKKSVETWNPHQLFVQLSKASPGHSHPFFLKCLKLIVHSDISPEHKEFVLKWISPWYPLKAEKKLPTGATALNEIAKTSWKDACTVFDSLENRAQRSYVVSFVTELVDYDADASLERLTKFGDLSKNDKMAVVRAVLQSKTCAKETLKKIITYITSTTQAEEIFSLTIRKIWDLKEFDLGNELLRDCIKNKRILTAKVVNNLVSDYVKMENDCTCVELCLDLASSDQISDVTKTKLEEKSLKVLNGTHSTEQVIRLIKAFLENKRTKEAFNYLEKHCHKLNEQEYENLFLAIFIQGNEETNLLIQYLTKLTRPILNASQKLQDTYMQYFEKLRAIADIQTLFEFLELPLTLSIFAEKYQTLKVATLDDVIKTENSHKILSLLKLLTQSQDINLVLVHSCLKFFTLHLSRETQKELKKFLMTDHRRLATAFYEAKEFSLLMTLQKLLHLLGVESHIEAQEPFLESLHQDFSIEVLIQGLRDERFPVQTAMKQSLVLRALEGCYENEERFKLLVTHLDENTSEDVLREVAKRAVYFEVVLERFSSHEQLVTLLLLENFNTLKKLPQEKLCDFLKKWSTSFKNSVSLYPLLGHVLQHEGKLLPVLLEIIKKIGFNNLDVLSPFFIRTLKTSKLNLQKQAFDILVELDPLFDREHASYTPLWTKAVAISITSSFGSSFYLSLAGNQHFLTRTGTESYKVALLKACANDLNSNDAPFLCHMLREVWCKQTHKSELQELLLGVLSQHQDPSFDRSFFIELFQNLNNNEQIELYFRALLNQQGTSEIALEILENSIENEHPLPQKIYPLVLARLSDHYSLKERTLLLIQKLTKLQLIDENTQNVVMTNLFFQSMEHAVLESNFQFKEVEGYIQYWANIFFEPSVYSHEKILRAHENLSFALVRLVPYTKNILDQVNLTVGGCQRSLRSIKNTSENFEKHEFEFVVKFLKKLSYSRQSSEDLLNKVFFPLATKYIDMKTDEYEDHLKYLFYLGLSLTEVIKKKERVYEILQLLIDKCKKGVSKTCMGIALNNASSYAMGYTINPARIKGESHAGTSYGRQGACQKKAVFRPITVEDLLTLFPSNYNLMRNFIIFMEIAKFSPQSYKLDVDYYKLIVKNFKHIEEFGSIPVEEKIFDMFMECFTLCFTHSKNESLTEIFTDFHGLLQRRFHTENATTYYQMSLKSLNMGYQTHAITDMNYLKKLEEIYTKDHSLLFVKAIEAFKPKREEAVKEKKRLLASWKI